jgi:hypothetical protein
MSTHEQLRAGGRTLFAGAAALLSLLAGPHGAQAAAAEWNASPDPWAQYGPCGTGSAIGNKRVQVLAAGLSMDGVLAIAVLECGASTGGGPSHQIPCPPGSPYANCVEDDNDGLDNAVRLGVVRTWAATNPNATAAGCASGSSKPKIAVLRSSGRDPRLVTGLVTLACEAATVPGRKPAYEIPCPAGPHPYAYCLVTGNDGSGHAVLLGVLTAQGAGDPHALYGECHAAFASYGVRPGFSSKAALVTGVGRSTANVRTIDLISCSVPASYGGGFPGHLTAADCSTTPWTANPLVRYRYCIVGTDARGNAVIAGVR